MRRVHTLLCFAASCAASQLRNLQAGYQPVWGLAGSFVSDDNVPAVQGAGAASSSNFVCKCNVGTGEMVLGNRPKWNDRTNCDGSVANGTTASCVTSQLLVRDATMAWLHNSTALPLMGSYVGAEGVFVCRALRTDVVTDTAWYAGSTAGAAAGDCSIVPIKGGNPLRSSYYQILASLPPLESTNWTAPGVTPVNPSPSASPSASASPSPSAPLPAPGTVATYVPPTQPSNAQQRGYPGGFSLAIPALLAGAEEDGKRIYACIGYLPNGDALPGKYSLGTGWSWCDVPHDESEENDAMYVFIRDSPYLVWHAAGMVPLPSPSSSLSPASGFNASAAPAFTGGVIPSLTVPPSLSSIVPNATLAVVGMYKGSASIPCRAWKATTPYAFMGYITYAGPHVGVYGTDAAGVGQCSFGYGNAVSHVKDFDLLYTLPEGTNPAAVAALVTAMPKPSGSATPSVTPTRSPSSTPAIAETVQWMAASAAAAVGVFTAEAGGFVQSGTNGMDYSRWPYFAKNTYVCRATLADMSVVPGRFESISGGCTVGTNGTESMSMNYEVLIRSPWLTWAPPEGTILNMTGPLLFSLPAGASPVESGKVGVRTATVCRAYIPGASTGPLSGYTLGKLMGEQAGPGGVWPQGVNVCNYGYGGQVMSITPYDILLQLPADLTANGWNRGGAPALAAPSSSPTPTPSPTPSSSAAPPVPGQLEWRKLGRADIGPLVAGVENTVSTIYVCRGYIPGIVAGTVDVVPGKYESNFRFCDIPVRGSEMNDAEYDILRSNPLLTWVAHNASGGVSNVAASWPGSQSYSSAQARGTNIVPAGAMQVIVGKYDGLPSSVCRAFHPLVKGGPHAGYTDGELYGSTPLCFFSYGGKVIRTAPFDYLFMFPVPSPSPSPVSATPSPSPSATTSTSGSGTPSPTGSPSRTPTPSTTASNTPTASQTPPVSGTPTPTPTPSSSQYPSSTPSPSRTPSRTPSISQTPSTTPVTAAVDANGSKLPSPSASPSQGSGSGGATPGPPAMSPVGVVAIIAVVLIGGVCALGALRKKRVDKGTAIAGESGEGDRVRIVTSAA